MTDQPDEDRRFSSDEAAELIRRATELSQRDDDGMTFDQLIDVAGEVGIRRTHVEAAVDQARREEAERQQQTNVPSTWRAVSDRCLEILCLKPVQRSGT